MIPAKSTSLYESAEFQSWLRSAVLISLFSDRRARPDQAPPPIELGSLRGWVGDLAARVSGDQTGSHFWLLGRRKQTEAVRKEAEQWARDCLQWLLDDGWAHEIKVSAAWEGRGWLSIHILIYFNAALIFDELFKIQAETAS